MTFEFATVCDDRYLAGGLVALFSLSRTVPGFDDLPVTVFHAPDIAPLSESARSALRRVAPQCRFVPVDQPVYRRAELSVPNHRAAFLTLETFRMGGDLPVVFFDADVIFLADISSIAAIAAPFVACQAGPVYRDESGSRSWCPINSGFFMVRPDWRADSIYQKMLSLVPWRRDTAFADQQVIDAAFAGRDVHLLPDTWNFRHWGGVNRAGRPLGDDALFRRYRESVRVLHFSSYVSRQRPWAPEPKPPLTAFAVWSGCARACVAAYPDLAAVLMPALAEQSDESGREYRVA